MEIASVKLIQKPVAKLIPYANNARTHDKEQIKQIASSIKEFGFNAPVLIDSDDGIIAGHGRVKAAELLGLKEVPTITLPHLSETQKKAYILADNRMALNAGWDAELLKLELTNLDELDFDLGLTGFDHDEIKLYLGNIDEVDFPGLADGEKEPFQQKTFTLHDEQVSIIDDAILKAKTYPEYDEGLNENSNGNALSFICSRWLENVS